ncbi:hypothetical protein BAUCODRAFT_66666 [Baudoinia panamericana UAMH 10762]|uniref:Glucose-methanol-choline oxidoreductase N-terminal domain-containing protein n=1 Tax=Baudoinia panamericana (strain UAMH 10762) TaxID=717646 RepID=M2MM64_BAUPA|nr:uncharacterized protein BAUCODRAFT_66666 [Baudoinia panamericana UAMH 10762]EMC97776.1 hypothetical protein BAUCODRAFT_66666 [Baudoinia panamericana UAMH 10762]
MSLYDSFRFPLSAGSRQLVIALAVSAIPAYFVGKAIREIIHVLFPSFIPGETNTALLATVKTTPGTSEAKDLENVAEFDYIIVGGGTAGCVLAARLTEDANSKVLVIESGHSDLKQIFSRLPGGFNKLFKTGADWDLTTEPEKQCEGRKMYWPRGRMLGGCSAINAMIYNRGAPDDFDEWERLGNKGWSYASLRPYMSKAESFHPSGEGPNPVTDDDLKHHGRDGPWQTGYSWCSPLTRTFLDACEAIGISKRTDLNTPSGMIGTAHTQTFIDRKGQRSSTAVAYLTEQVASRPNLHIAVAQTVTRIIFDKSGSQPRAVGVEMASSAVTPFRYLAKARREVLVCGGAVHTPQILKLSGIGGADELKSHGISLIADRPGVGSNLADHILTVLVFKCKAESLQWAANTLKSLPALVQWLRTGTGPLTTNVAECTAFVRTQDRDDASSSLKEKDETSGATSADLELLAGPLAFTNHGLDVAPTNQDYCSIGCIGLRPTSRGTVTLADASPFTPPRVRANYLETQYDRDIMTYGLQLCMQMLKTKPYRDIFDGWYKGWTVLPDNPSDEQLLQYARQRTETVYHPVCSAKMGPATDPMSVVDERLKVHGVRGLRVVDASIFPKPVACHPCAVVVSVAEKAADMIKEDRR